MFVRSLRLCIILSNIVLQFSNGFENRISNVDNETEINILHFRQFVAKYRKAYGNASKEYWRRFQIFQDSLRRHKTLNSQRSDSTSARFGITPFSDLTKDEFTSMILQGSPTQEPTLVSASTPEELPLLRLQQSNAIVRPIYTTNIPQTFDWQARDKGKVTEARNQQACGACWAFAVVETAETMSAIKCGNLTNLSVQQVVDCDTLEQKCLGGDLCRTARWLATTQTYVTTEANYPLNNLDEPCKMSFVGNENAMMTEIFAHGPLAVAVDATLWQDYLGGIIQHNCDANLNHAVTLVGYNSSGSVPYFIAKNSWGSEFGHDGYLYIAIGKNVCGVATTVVSLDVV